MSDTVKRTEPWPEDAPCYKCGEPVGAPWGNLVPQRPVCPVCAWDNIQKFLDDDDFNAGESR